MKFTASASSIVFMMCIFLAGCDSIHIPQLLQHDEVPPEIRDQPRLVETPAPSAEDEKDWPLLGNVPFKPDDFSPKIVNDHYMNELEFHRDEAEAAKKKALEEDPTLTNAAPQNNSVPQLMAPQFLK
jgi:hypothetical protein